MSEIGTKIRKIRELRNYSRAYLATKLGLSSNSYGKIERNEVSVTYHRLEEIAAVLEVNIVYLISFDEKKILKAE